MPSSPLDGLGEAEPGTASPTWRRLWFVAPESGIKYMTRGVVAHVDRGGGGGVRINGSAFVAASVVETVLDVCNDLDYLAGSFCGSEVDSISFGYFDDPLDASRPIALSIESDLNYAIGQFMGTVNGPVSGWFGERCSVDRLLAIARSPRAMYFDKINPDPMRLRGSVILSLMADRHDDAAAVMDWYINRNSFHKKDSKGQAEAFDGALRQQFPEYAQARKRSSGSVR